MTEWFTKHAGDDVATNDDDPSMLLVGADAPEWIALPPELGGARVRVLSIVTERCPRADHPVRHYRLEGTIHVAECPVHGGFLWYRARAK